MRAHLLGVARCERPQRVIVGLSGGVDSAVAAWMLQAAGHSVEAVFMKNWEDDDAPGQCSAERDLADARQVADTLGIVLHQVNFAAEYRRDVFEHCLGELRAGRTPNPDVLCNREIKFKRLLGHALRLGAERVATGHYARLAEVDGHTRLLRARDARKDQTYFLYMVPQSALQQSLFPLGELLKSEVRAIAESVGFDNFEKKDSTGICFIGERDFRSFMQRYLPSTPGPVVTTDGLEIGHHEGLAFYTIGQRQGLGIGGVPGRSGPWFVVDKDLAGNRLIVAEGGEHPALFSGALRMREAHWCSGGPPNSGRHLQARLRHGQPLQDCVLETLGDGGDWRLRFTDPQRAATPGQSVVLYDHAVCLGGGVIADTTPLPENPR
jgi:tRNA-uridine 2-sulfurtransferase